MAQEEHLTLEAGGVSLEARFRPGAGPGGAVITHPHPLYGGSMDNNVVWAAAQALGERGYSTLCFNFRGVGRSTGAYGGGVEEVQDVAAALDFLRSRIAGPLLLAGYSFGAAVAARGLGEGLAADGAVLISPPIAFMDLAFLPDTPHLSLVVVGDRDALCPLAELEALFRKRQPPVAIKVVPGADHFYLGKEGELSRILLSHPLP
uniref:Alpha/beta fold hydrolase n=1 Tax=Desulfobacca acetoxidans TaxID=60893 RepID=A0A7V4G7Z3_9BACT